MGDAREYSEVSEDRTEAFSQTEIQARLQRSRMEEFNAVNSSVPLDKLVVSPDDDFRILMRPLARDRSLREDRNVLPVALRPDAAEEDSLQEVLAVRQTARDVSYTINIPDPWTPDRRVVCIVYYDPASDNQILLNRSNVPFTLTRISQEPEESRGVQYTINPEFRKALAPGTWRISMDGTDLLDVRLLERPPTRVRLLRSASSCPSGPSDVLNSSGKRTFVSGDDEGSPEKRRRSTGTADDKKEDSVIVFVPPKAGAKGKELVASTGHPLMDLQPDETLEISQSGGLVGCTLTMKDRIASSTLSSVFTAQHSAIPGRLVVVKVVNTAVPPGSKANEGALANRVITQAQTWLRELENHKKLKRHNNIVQLYGGDARFLSLYLEPVNARDLGAWKNPETDLFSGDRSDALRILKDSSNALEYLHRLRLDHNDIRPANILFSRERGAVLCDMGHSSEKGQRAPGGTPWYMPPEYIGLRQRGPPSDVWALGVVMLYVMGKMSLPESRADRKHPRHLNWMIAHIHANSPQLQSAAITRMRTWLNEVTAVRAGLDLGDKLERLVHGMLAPNPKERLTMKDIVSQLFVEQEG